MSQGGKDRPNVRMKWAKGDCGRWFPARVGNGLLSLLLGGERVGHVSGFDPRPSVRCWRSLVQKIGKASLLAV
jgi:hypothetical protein